MVQTIDYNAGTVAATYYVDGTKVGNDVPFTLPPADYMTTEAQVNGNIDVPIVGIFDDMETAIRLNNMNSAMMISFEPRTHTYELRWKEFQFEEQTVNSKYVLHKVRITGIPKSAAPEIEVNNGEKGEYELRIATLIYAHYVDGEEILYIDRPGKMFRVNGKDVYSDIRNGL